MRLLKKEFLEIFEDLYKAEEYDLNDIYSKDLENKGLIICYLLATETSLITIELKPKNEEIGVPLEWYRRYDKNSFKEMFSSLYEFLIEFDYDDFDTWHLKVLYKNVEVEIGGKRGISIIRLTSDKKYQLNILPLLYKLLKHPFFPVCRYKHLHNRNLRLLPETIYIFLFCLYLLKQGLL